MAASVYKAGSHLDTDASVRTMLPQSPQEKMGKDRKTMEEKNRQRTGMQTEEVEIVRDGLTLRGIWQRPGEAPCPVVILFHGFTGDLGAEPDSLFGQIAGRLVQEGIASVRFDFNGHGKSGGAFSDMNVLNELEDAIAILEYVRSLPFVTEISVLGHSQGGVVGGMLAGCYPDVVRKLVLLAPAATLKDDAQRGVCMDAVYDTRQIPKQVEVYGGTYAVGGHYFRIARWLPIYEVTGLFTGPALLIHGRRDSVVDATASERYERVLQGASLRLLDGIDHGMNGTDREQILEEIVVFLSGTVHLLH